MVIPVANAEHIHTELMQLMTEITVEIRKMDGEKNEIHAYSGLNDTFAN